MGTWMVEWELDQCAEDGANMAGKSAGGPFGVAAGGGAWGDGPDTEPWGFRSLGGRTGAVSSARAHTPKTVTNALSGAGGLRVTKHFGGEFDPGSGSTQAACLMHASRTGSLSGGSRGGRVRNTWAICLQVGGSPRKRGVIPHVRAGRVGRVRKAFGRLQRSLRPIS